jgi:transcription elongation factor Elf1
MTDQSVTCTRCNKETSLWEATKEGWNIAIDSRKGRYDVRCGDCAGDEMRHGN